MTDVKTVKVQTTEGPQQEPPLGTHEYSLYLIKECKKGLDRVSKIYDNRLEAKDAVIQLLEKQIIELKTKLSNYEDQ